MWDFRKKSIGLDISDEAVEAAELAGIGRRIIISGKGRQELGRAVVEKGIIKNEKELAKAIEKVFSQAQPFPISGRKIIFGLPQDQVFTYILTIKSGKKRLAGKEIEELVKRELKKEFGAANNQFFSFRLINKSENIAEILLIAVNREIVSAWRNFFQKLKIEAEEFDVRALADYRSLFISPAKTAVLLIDIGNDFSYVNIFNRQGLCYSRSVDVGDKALIRKIAQRMNLSRQEAEARKEKIGLADKQKKIYRVLAKDIKPLAEEIKQALNYFERRGSQPLNEIILTGKCRTKDLAGYLQEQVDFPVRIGSSAVIQANESIENVLKKSESLLYLSAIGLALRQLDRKWRLRDPAIIIKKKNKNGDLVNIPFIESSLKNMFEEIFGKKKALTAVILGAVLIVLGAIFWTGRKAGNQSASQIDSLPGGETVQYNQNQTFDLKISVAARESEQNSERAKGRIIENTISQAADYQEAVAQSRLAVERELKTGERLWIEPLAAKDKNFPVTVRWLAYSNEEAEKLFLAEVDKLNQGEADYVLDKIEMAGLEETINSGIFNLKGKVTVYLNQLFEAAEQAGPTAGEEEKPKAPTVKKVTIKETETGWLNVRKGPGTNYPTAVKIYPGEKYELLEESGNWLKIKVDEDTIGWIFSTYGLKE